jgi:hypothetical protein
MLIKLVRLTEKLTGFLLGGLAVSAPVGNTLICLAAIFFGPAITLRLLG